MAKKKDQVKEEVTPVKVDKSLDAKKLEATSACKVKKIKKEQNMTKYILKTAGITLACIVVSFFYILSILMVFAPTVPAKLFSAIGSKGAVTICYEQEFKRKPSTYAMYNVIQCAVQSEDNDRIVAYTRTLRQLKAYDEFEEKMNTESRKNATKKNIAFVYDIDSYLNSLYIQSLYEKGENLDIRMAFYQNMNSEDHYYTIVLVPYINALYADESRTKDDKADELNDWLNSFTQNGVGNILDVLKVRLDKIEDINTEALSIGEKIFNVYTQMKVNNALYKAYDLVDDADQRATYASRTEALAEYYDNLVNS